jgi:hypothetical protein
VSDDPVRRALAGVDALLEAGERAEAVTAIAYVAGLSLELDAEELAAGRRRALLVLAAGGDPHRELDLGAPAVDTLARDLDGPELRERLATAIRSLPVENAPQVAELAAALAADPELALRALACGLLAEELAEEED